MTSVIRQTMVIARRDFLAMVATPTFLLFLLAPLMMVGFGMLSGLGGAQMAKSAIKNERLIVIADARDAADIQAAETFRNRDLMSEDTRNPIVFVVPTRNPAEQQRTLFSSKDVEVQAVMRGPLTAPVILHAGLGKRDARYLESLAETVVRARDTGTKIDRDFSKATIDEFKRVEATPSGRMAAGTGAVFTIFMLTLLLAGQAVGMLAEEKSNKVIEILAAAVRLEAVFFGKLMGMFGVAVLFIGFWGIIGAFGVSLLPTDVSLANLAPAIGLPTFLILCALYFSMAFMLLGAVFLGIGAQASTIREIQMLSLPITIFQMVMLVLSSAAAGNPGSKLATIAQIFPFSSPFAMAARGATDATLWPHFLALGWQALWVALTIWVSVRLFRVGVLKSGSGFFGSFGKKARHRDRA